MKKNCAGCGKEFYVKPSRPDIKYCSLKCKWPNGRYVDKVCVTCGKTFKALTHKQDTAKYCSNACQHKGLIQPKISLTCTGCGKPFEVRPHKKDQQYCSKPCRMTHQTGNKNPAWTGGLLTKQCLHCGKDYQVKQNRKDISNFCSLTCRGEWHSQHETYKRRITLTCLNCGKYFETLPKWHDKKFCSKQCYSTHYKRYPELYNKQLQENPPIIVACAICKQEFKLKPSAKRTSNCCSRTCFKAWCKRRVLESNSNWKGGRSFEPYPLGWNKDLKSWIRERDKFTCQLTGKTEAEIGYSLCVHHIDYNKDNLDPMNLISLTRKAHAMTNGNREHWTAFFTNLMNTRFPQRIKNARTNQAACQY